MTCLLFLTLPFFRSSFLHLCPLPSHPLLHFLLLLCAALQTCESLCSPFECNDLSCVVANPEATFEPVREAILNLRERVEDMCNVELGKITKTGVSEWRTCILHTHTHDTHISTHTHTKGTTSSDLHHYYLVHYKYCHKDRVFFPHCVLD